MRYYTLTDEQEKIMKDWIEKHNKSKKCPINKQRKKDRKKGIYACGGDCQYETVITHSSFADIASIRCECGEEQFLGEV